MAVRLDDPMGDGFVCVGLCCNLSCTCSDVAETARELPLPILFVLAGHLEKGKKRSKKGEGKKEH